VAGWRVFPVKACPFPASAFDEIVGIRQLSKSGSDLGLVSRFKELLRGSRTGCQYRWNPISCTSLLPCHGTARWYGREGEGIGGDPKESDDR
jgi:hypothetical protein